MFTFVCSKWQILLCVGDFNVSVHNTMVRVGNCRFCAGLVVTMVRRLLQFQLYFNMFIKVGQRAELCPNSHYLNIIC